MSDFPTERRDDKGNGGLLVLLALLALALLGNFLGTGEQGGAIPSEPTPVPPGYAGPIRVTIDARGYWAANHDSGEYLAFLGELNRDDSHGTAVELLGQPAGRSLMVDASNAPHYAADAFVKAAKAVGWSVSVIRV